MNLYRITVLAPFVGRRPPADVRREQFSVLKRSIIEARDAAHRLAQDYGFVIRNPFKQIVVTPADLDPATQGDLDGHVR